ncbi:MAG: hypothetical protein ACERKZ_09490 [Lachnotalea sp.]
MIKKEEHTIVVPNNYKLEVEQLGRCIIDGEQPYVSHAFSLANGRTIDKVWKEMGY